MSWQFTFDTCAFTWWEHLILTIVPFLLGLLLGYLLWYRYRQRVIALEDDVDHLRRELSETEDQDAPGDEEISALKDKIRRLESELSSSRLAFSSLQIKYNALSAQPKVTETTAAPIAPVAAKSTTRDKLTRIEGVGPKTQDVLYAKGVYTFRDLADSTPSKIKKMLDDAGPHFRILDPGTWPKQAKLAANDQWDKLRTYQEYLIGGRDPKVIRASIPTPDISQVAAIFGKKYPLDDLKLIEGVGPKIEKLLIEAGIDSWWALSETKVPRIRQILEAAGPRFRLADPSTWPRQARMASRGEWKKLKAYQDKLDGGRVSG